VKKHYVIIEATLEVPVPEYDDDDEAQSDQADDYAQQAVTASLAINDIEWELNDIYSPKEEE
jgi:hypothetical protein